MLAAPRPLTVFWEPPHDTPPSVLVRRLGPAILAGLLAGGAVYAACGYTLWHVLGALPTLAHWPLWRIMLMYPLVIMHASAAIHARFLPGLVVADLVSLAVAVLAARPHSATQHIAGAMLLAGNDALKAARSLSKKRQRAAQADQCFSLHPALVLPRQDWTRHVLIAGSVGSGKTQILLPLVDQLVRTRTRALVLDTKGDYTSHFPGVILSPWDSRTRFWDIAADVRTVSDAQAFAAALVPERSQGDHHFDTAARTIITGVVVSLQAMTAGKWGWRSLADALSGGIALLHEMLLAHYPSAVPLLGKGSDKTQAVTLSTLAAHTQVISNLARAWGNGDVLGRSGKMKPFSLRAWAQDDYTGATVIMLHAGSDRVLSRAWLALATSIAGQALLALPDSRTRCVFLVLDELTAVGRLDIESIVERGRSKGVCVLAGFQDLAQVREVYGANIAAALASMVGMHVICQVAPGETRERVAEWAGKRRVAIPTVTQSGSGKQTSTSTGVHEEMRALVNAADLTSDLGPHQAKGGFAVRAMVIPGGSDLLVLDFPGRVWPQIRRPHVAAPWTLPGVQS